MCLNLNVGIYVLTAIDCVDKHVDESHQRYEIAKHIRRSVSNIVLQQGQDTAANHHHHENSRPGIAVFAQALSGKVENARPQHTGAKATAYQERYSNRHVCCEERGSIKHIHVNTRAVTKKNSTGKENNSHRGHDCHHALA